MRVLIDILIGLMVIAVVAGGVVLYHSQRQDEQDIVAVQQALGRLSEQAAYHNAVQSAMAGHDTLLVHMSESWFGDKLPLNVLVSEGHPWIDLAPPGDLGTHPPDPVITSQTQAGFWYNPTLGIFRARVTPGLNEVETLSLYNQINDTSLEVFEQIPDPARTPIAHVPGTTPAQQYATMANRTWSETRDPAQKDEALYKLPEPDPAAQAEAGPEPEFVNYEDERVYEEATRKAEEQASAASDSVAPGQAEESEHTRPTLLK